MQPVTLPTRDSLSKHLYANLDTVYHATSSSKRQIGFLSYLTMKFTFIHECIRSFPNTKLHDSSLCVKEVGKNNEVYTYGSLCSEVGVPLVYLSDETLVGDVIEYNADDNNWHCVPTYLSTPTLFGILHDTHTDCTAGGLSFFIEILPFVNWIKEQISLEKSSR